MDNIYDLESDWDATTYNRISQVQESCRPRYLNVEGGKEMT